MGLFSWIKKHAADIVDPVGAIVGTDNKYVNAARGVLEPPGALGSRRIIEGAETGGLRGAIGGLSDAAAWGAGDFISPLYTTPEGYNPIYDRVGPIMAGYFGGPIAGSVADYWAKDSPYNETAKLHLGSVAGLGGEGWGGSGLFKKGLNKVTSAFPSTEVQGVAGSTAGGSTGAGKIPSLTDSSNLDLAFQSRINPLNEAAGPMVNNVPLREAINQNISNFIPISNGVDYIPPKTTSIAPASNGTKAVVPDTTGGTSVPSTVMSKIQQYSPLVYAGSQILNAINQAGMAEDMNDAQTKSYEDYLSLINPPEEVKQARYNTLRNQVSTTATDARRRLRDTLASRGIRGRGIGGPNAALERSVMDAQNNAFNQIYGTYNVPGEAPPVNYAPSTANILGKNISDIGTLLMMQNLYNNAQ